MEVKLNLILQSFNLCLDAAVILYFCLWPILNYLWLRPKRLERWLRAQGFKGNSYRLWHGDLKDFGRMVVDVQSKPINLGDDIDPFVMPFHHHIIQKYGKKPFMWNGPNPRIFIMDPHWIREVLRKHHVFVKLYTNPLNRLLITGILVHEGEKWAKERRLVNAAFTIAKLKDMIPLMHICCMELVEKWEAMLLDKGSHEVDVWPYFSNLTADIISRTAFGSNYEEGKEIFLLQKEQARLVSQFSRSLYIPGSRFLPTKANNRIKKIARDVETIVKGIIRQREEAVRRGGEKKSNDLLGILLESSYKEEGNNGNGREVGISIEDVIEECKLFYFGGQETTSTLLVWTMVMLSIHQNWQMQAREEVLQAFGKSRLDFRGLFQLKKVTMILLEVLRLYSPAPALLRTTRETIELGDLILPCGVEIVLPLLFLHHDKEVWGDDANEFRPERFAQGVTKAAKDGQSAAYFPFGSGPRICIGLNFAMMEAKVALANILQHFSFELSPFYEHAPVLVLTLQPKYGAKIMLRKI